jgi:hypothetical protein
LPGIVNEYRHNCVGYASNKEMNNPLILNEDRAGVGITPAGRTKEKAGSKLPALVIIGGGAGT